MNSRNSIEFNFKKDKNRDFIDVNLLRKQRTEETRAYGKNSCQAIFYNRPECIIRAWFVHSLIPDFSELMHWMAKNRKAYHVTFDSKELNKVSGTEHHGGICLLIKKRTGITVENWISKTNNANDCIVCAENIDNPHNIGAIMRSCAHFDIKGILVKNTTILESGAAIRTAEGGAEYIQPIVTSNLEKAIEQLYRNGYTIAFISNLSHKSISIFELTLPRKLVLILNQEYNVYNNNFSKCSINIYINGTGNIKNLNISVSTGVLLAEWWRQNRKRA